MRLITTAGNLGAKQHPHHNRRVRRQDHARGRLAQCRKSKKYFLHCTFLAGGQKSSFLLEALQLLLDVGFRLLHHLASHLLNQPPSRIFANGLELLLLLRIQKRRELVLEKPRTERAVRATRLRSYLCTS